MVLDGVLECVRLCCLNPQLWQAEEEKQTNKEHWKAAAPHNEKTICWDQSNAWWVMVAGVPYNQNQTCIFTNADLVIYPITGIDVKLLCFYLWLLLSHQKCNDLFLPLGFCARELWKSSVYPATQIHATTETYTCSLLLPRWLWAVKTSWLALPFPHKSSLTELVSAGSQRLMSVQLHSWLPPDFSFSPSVGNHFTLL